MSAKVWGVRVPKITRTRCKKAAHQDQDDPEIETARWRTGVVFRLIGVLTIVFHFGLVPDPDAAAAIWLDRLDVKR